MSSSADSGAEVYEMLSVSLVKVKHGGRVLRRSATTRCTRTCEGFHPHPPQGKGIKIPEACYTRLSSTDSEEESLNPPTPPVTGEDARLYPKNRRRNQLHNIL